MERVADVLAVEQRHLALWATVPWKTSTFHCKDGLLASCETPGDAVMFLTTVLANYLHSTCVKGADTLPNEITNLGPFTTHSW